MSSIPLSLRRTEERPESSSLDSAVAAEGALAAALLLKHAHTHTHTFSLSRSLCVFYSAQPLFAPHGQKRNQRFASKRSLSLSRLPLHTHTCPLLHEFFMCEGVSFLFYPRLQTDLLSMCCMSVCLSMCVCVSALGVIHIHACVRENVVLHVLEIIMLEGEMEKCHRGKIMLWCCVWMQGCCYMVLFGH